MCVYLSVGYQDTVGVLMLTRHFIVWKKVSQLLYKGEDLEVLMVEEEEEEEEEEGRI